MAKRFNITGNCFSDRHYMADVSAKLAQTLKMVEAGDYFIINRPRQFGKTTTLFTIANTLRQSGDYLVFNISFEGVGDLFFSDEKIFAPGFLSLLAEHVELRGDEALTAWLEEQKNNATDMKTLSRTISRLVIRSGKKIVLLIDEVDKSSNNQLFVSFLGMLRNKYLMRGEEPTFHSIVLAGVHDVKSLKLKIRPGEEQKYNSPWNIASEYKVDLSFQPHEIKPMLEEYARDKKVKMDTGAIAERLFYHTSGYPFLVSKLCKMLDEDGIVRQSEWTENDVDLAVQALIKETNTNFESLTKNLENDPELYQAVFRVAVESDYLPFNLLSPLTNLGVLHGIFAPGNGGGRIKIHNRVYSEIIVNYMTDELSRKTMSSFRELASEYKNPDRTLNMEAVMLGFQAFMKKEYSRKDRDFLEKNGRLVFLAFLKPIINGAGHDFKEPQISDEKRLDVVVTYLHQKFVIELKLWHGEKAHQNGLRQLADYLDLQNLNEGYLLIFDHAKTKKWHSKWIDFEGKRVFEVWV